MIIKKDFFNKPKAKPAHPAEAFVPQDEAEPVLYTPVRRRPETRSKRLNLLVTPSLHQAMQQKADALGISFNEACNLAMSNFVKRK